MRRPWGRSRDGSAPTTEVRSVPVVEVRVPDPDVYLWAGDRGYRTVRSVRTVTHTEALDALGLFPKHADRKRYALLRCPEFGFSHDEVVDVLVGGYDPYRYARLRDPDTNIGHTEALDVLDAGCDPDAYTRFRVDGLEHPEALTAATFRTRPKRVRRHG